MDGSVAWTKSDVGTLRIYLHKATGKTRLVQRNRAGTVKLNVAIANGMYCLEKVRVVVRRKVRKPKVVEVIQFYAVADEERGVECFMLKVKVKAKPEKLEKRDGNCDVAGTNALAYWGQQH